jgi:hypothetical protein
MSQETLRDIGMDLGKSALGVVIARQLDLSSKINLGNSFAMRHASNGVIYFAVSDAINYVTEGSSKLFSADFTGVFDDSLFFGALSGVSAASNADRMLYDTMRNVTNNRDMLAIAVDSAILTTGRVLGKYVDATPSAPYVLQAARHPSRLLMK